MRVQDATRYLDIQYRTLLSVAGCGRLQLGVLHLATSVDYCKQLIIFTTFCGSRFSTGRLLAIYKRLYLYFCRLQDVSNIFTDPIYPYLINEGRVNCSKMRPAQQRNRDSLETSPNLKTCKNEWQNFSENLIIMALKLLELTQFASQNLSIFFNFVRCWGSVVMTFLN